MKKTIECKNSKTWWLGLKESPKRLKQNLKVFPILGPAQEILEIRQNNKLLQNREVSSRWKKLICIWTRVWIRIWWSSLLMTRKYRRPSLLLTWTGMGTWVQAKLGLCLTRWVRLPQTKKLTKWYGWLTLMVTGRSISKSFTRWRRGWVWLLWGQPFQCPRKWDSSIGNKSRAQLPDNSNQILLARQLEVHPQADLVKWCSQMMVVVMDSLRHDKTKKLNYQAVKLEDNQVVCKS